MTEAEWLCCVDPTPMLVFLKERRVSERKLRLFACACCRRVWSLIEYPLSREAVEKAELAADGMADVEELCAAADRAFDYHGRAYAARAVDAGAFAAQCAAVIRFSGIAAYMQAGGVACQAAEYAAYGSAAAVSTYTKDGTLWMDDNKVKAHTGIEKEQQAWLVRDVFGNPFRPTSADTTWLTPKVIKLAQEIYNDRDFSRMPQLADILEEAGCTNIDILTHLRSPGPHVRGCWVVDIILGKPFTSAGFA